MKLNVGGIDRSLRIVLGLVLLGLSACQSHPPSAGAREPVVDVAALEQAAQARVQPFAGQLLSAMQGAMQSGGATQAIDVCTELAPALAKQASTDGWTVGRTSDKVRNPDNAADAWELAVLNKFSADLAAGQPLAQLKHSEVVRGEYRYMQAIGVGQPCLACHGQNLAPAVADSLKAAYPKDQAVGYQLGQLRGAISLRKPL